MVKPTSNKYKKHVEQYRSYFNRIDEWRQVDESEQSRILRSVISDLKERNSLTSGVECLVPECPTRLFTYNGMQYHLKFCGIPASERLKSCRVCHEPFKAGEIRDHEKLHAVEVVKKNGGTRPNKRKSAIQCRRNFNEIAEILLDDETFPEIKTEQPAKRSKPSTKGVDFRIEESDGETAEDGFPEEDYCAQQPSASSPSKRTVDHQKHKKFTFLPENYRKDWVTMVSMAYERIITDDHIVSGFEDWTIERNAWFLLPNSDLEPYIEQYVDKSTMFSFQSAQKMSLKIKMLESSISPLGGVVNFCGSPVIACAWCPIPVDHSVQYIAVSTHQDANLSSSSGGAKGCIQLWSVTFTVDKVPSSELEFLLAHDLGVVMDLKWCPSGVWQSADDSHVTVSSNCDLPRLGALAATSGTGEIAIYCIPHPACLRTDKNLQTVRVYRTQPLVTLYCGLELVSYTMDWSHFKGHEKLAAGFHDGSVSVWNLKKQRDLLLDDSNRLLPVTSFPACKAPIRSLRWYSATKILLSSLDRNVSMWDVEEGICLSNSTPQVLLIAVGCGPVLPGYAFSCESTLQLPHFPCYVDVSSKASINLSRFHQSHVMAFDTSPWNGCILGVDNQGVVSLSCIKCVAPQDSIKRKFIEATLFRTVCHSVNDREEYFIPHTVKEAKNCTLQFVFENSNLTKTQLENEYKRLELSGHYPLAALYAVSWNPNKAYANWCCFGGQAGLLFVHNANV